MAIELSPLFKPELVPSDIVSPDGVASVNAVVDRLRARRVNILKLKEEASLFRVSNKVRVYDQSQLRRCLQFIDAAHHLVYSGLGLTALVAVRCIFETVASYLHFANGFEQILGTKDLQKIDEFVRIRTFATRLEPNLQLARPLDVKATNILNQIDKMETLRPGIREDYETLCEYTHPNGYGAYLYFAVHDKCKDQVAFSDVGAEPAHDLKWVLVAGHLLTFFDEAIERVEGQLPALSKLGSDAVQLSK